jgi:hypothetical protein
VAVAAAGCCDGGGFDDDDVAVAAGAGDSAAVCDAGAGWSNDSGLVAVGDVGQVADGLQDEFVVCFGCAGGFEDGPDCAEGVCRRGCRALFGFGHGLVLLFGVLSRMALAIA